MSRGTETPSRPPVRVLVAGDRSWHCLELARQMAVRLRNRYGSKLVVAIAGGGAVADAFTTAATEAGVKVERQGTGTPDLDDVAFVLAVHRWIDGSKKTASVVRAAMRRGLRVYLVEGGDREPYRVRVPPQGPKTIAASGRK